MHRHDLDLIAALAEGSLEEETLARARVESCEVCRAEFAAQQAAIAALRGIPTATMTAAERAVVHRELWTELTTPRPKERSRGRRYAWVYAAAGVFVLIGVAGALTLGQQQAARTFGEGASPLEQAATTSEETAAATTAPAAPAAPRTDAAPETDEEAGALFAPNPDPPDAEDFAHMADTVRDQFTYQDAATQARDHTELEACLDQAGLTAHTLAGQVERDRLYLFAVPEETGGERLPVWFVAFDDCTIVYVDE